MTMLSTYVDISSKIWNITFILLKISIFFWPLALLHNTYVICAFFFFSEIVLNMTFWTFCNRFFFWIAFFCFFLLKWPRSRTFLTGSNWGNWPRGARQIRGQDFCPLISNHHTMSHSNSTGFVLRHSMPSIGVYDRPLSPEHRGLYRHLSPGHRRLS